MHPTADEIQAAFDALVGAYRARCLWFLRPDYVPATLEEKLRVLGYIERHGDLAAFKRAEVIRRWLSPPSSEASAG